MANENYKEVKITTDYITLGQLLKFCDVIDSGSYAKIFLSENTVFVNGTLTSQRGKKLYPGSKVIINNSLFFEIVK